MGAAPSYSATKRYCNTYLEALSQLAHIRGLDITFTDIRPGFVDTELLSKDFHYPMMMKPQPVARSIVRGILSGKRIVTIDWRFRILVFFWRLIPSWLWVRLKIV
jgi:short-subunit dehydrogenase